jgi:hypothetical protein
MALKLILVTPLITLRRITPPRKPRAAAAIGVTGSVLAAGAAAIVSGSADAVLAKGVFGGVLALYAQILAGCGAKEIASLLVEELLVVASRPVSVR